MNILFGKPTLVIVPYKRGATILIHKMHLPWYTLGFWLTKRAQEDFPHLVNIPWRYGVGIYDFDRDARYFFVQPLNVIIALARWVITTVRWTVPYNLNHEARVLDLEVWYWIREIDDAERAEVDYKSRVPEVLLPILPEDVQDERHEPDAASS